MARRIKKKIRKQDKIFIFLYILFVAAIYFWIYFDRKYSICTTMDLIKNTNSGCFIYQDISNFCFFGWIITLVMLCAFTINNIMTKGIKALKTPALVILATALLFGIAELIFIAVFKK